MKTIVERLREHWLAWGSPTERDEGVNESVMAFDCKEASDTLERVQEVLTGLATEVDENGYVFCAVCFRFEKDGHDPECGIAALLKELG